ncbi:MAG: aminotransferase class V-fold PLP-dependent enzyme [Gemmatimonadetes bacterium]|nr:aminotransferase class V-fold PLP-dependent enzyme [Gemmatimonadota bacterium]
MADRLFSGASPEKVEEALAPLVDFQEDGMHIADLIWMVEDDLIPHLMRYELPSCQGLFNSPLEEGAAYGAEVALEWNQGVTNWQVSPGGAMLEELCCKALCRLFGFGPDADGTVLYSGTYANQQALYMALHHRAREAGFDFSETGLAGFEDPSKLAVVVSADAHFSLKHAVRFLGLGEAALVTVEVDKKLRMDADALRRTLADLRGRRDVFCVVATVGTTSTGAVDPVGEIADLCREEGTWLHADGAYGLAYSLIPEIAPLFRGLEKADTVSWDPHKQMAVPIPSSILFARDRELFQPMALFSDYWNRADAPGPNPGLKSIPSTRPFVALPLVCSIRHQGLNKLVERLRKPLDAIRGFYEELLEHRDVDPLHEPDTGVLCFRVKQAALSPEEVDRLQEHIYRTIQRKGKRIVSVTRVEGKPALRAVAISPEVTTRSLMNTLAEALMIAGAFR